MAVRALALVGALVLAGCGLPGDPRGPQEARACLEGLGLRVTDLPNRNPVQAASEPDHRLLLPNGAVYFFDFEKEAEDGMAAIENEAVRLHGTAERESRVIFLWRAGVSEADRERVRDCVLG